MANLTDSKAKTIKPGDKALADGSVTGLRLHPHAKNNGQGQWKLRYVSPASGKRRDMGLGSYPEVGIAVARKMANEAREQIASGIDPIDARHDATEVHEHTEDANELTFEQAARKRHAELSPGFKNAKHSQQWINTLATYVFPAIGDTPLSELKVADFAEALRPIWLDKVETAQRVKQRCSEVMDWAYSQGLVTGNPLTVVGKLLPKQPSKSQRVKHHPALPWRQLPAFFNEKLADQKNTSRALLAFVILTAARSGEARAAEWLEIDFDEKTWTVPASRMKTKLAHRVPLSEPALAILQEQRRRTKSDLVFPAPRGGVLTDMALTSFLRKHNVPSDTPGRIATAHGFRSSFRDWASENGYARDLAERALAHTIKDQAEAAYHRTDLLDQRREMMENWARHCTTPRKI